MMTIERVDHRVLGGDVAQVAALARSNADLLASSDRLPAELVEASLAAGLYRLCLPAELGGLRVALPESATLVETLSHANGSVGWCTVVANIGAALLGRIDETQARLIASDPDRLCVAGGFPPSAQGRRTRDGYEVTGRWSFVSGCTAATWFLGGMLAEPAFEGDTPSHLVAFFPADRATIVPNWDVTGLLATGSHDVAADAVAVPAGRTTPLIGGPRWSADPITAISFFGLGALVAAVPLGIARRALDELAHLATTKIPFGQRQPLVHDQAFQSRFATVLARLNSARNYLLDQAHQLWLAAEQDAVTQTAQAGSLLAVGEAAEAAVEAVRFAHEAAGTTAIRSSNTIARCHNDVLATTRHIAFNPSTRQVAGRVFLGLPAESPLIS
jgi:alkylation response protein AidB-like acyl-CoA dehydrogenase